MGKDGVFKLLVKTVPRSPSDSLGKNEWAQAVAWLIIVSIVGAYFCLVGSVFP